MRIIAGKYKGRTIVPPPNLPVRPTTDFARTGLFNLLSTRVDFETCSCLDLFAGTGAISYELASRGCPSILAVDRHAGCTNFIASMATKLEGSNIRTVKSDSSKFLLGCNLQFDLIFADPPFDITYREDLVHLVFSKNILKPEGYLILEHPSKEKTDTIPCFDFSRTYGNVGFSFFRKFGSTEQVSSSNI